MARKVTAECNLSQTPEKEPHKSHINDLSEEKQLTLLSLILTANFDSITHFGQQRRQRVSNPNI